MTLSVAFLKEAVGYAYEIEMQKADESFDQELIGQGMTHLHRCQDFEEFLGKIARYKDEAKVYELRTVDDLRRYIPAVLHAVNMYQWHLKYEMNALVRQIHEIDGFIKINKY